MISGALSLLVGLAMVEEGLILAGTNAVVTAAAERRARRVVTDDLGTHMIFII